jgi:nucleoside-diphosphate-sugar epimerase
MKILLTGGAGFIGSNIMNSLLYSSSLTKPVVVDNLSWGFSEYIEGEKDFIDFYNIDILNREALTDAMKGVDLVIHCAASLEVTLGQDYPEKDLTTNTLGTISVLEAMKKNGVDKLINFSSACVYGQGQIGMAPNKESDAILNSPQWSYGSSKLSAEIYCNQYAKTYGMNVVHIRPGIVCGPREWYGRVLTILLKNAVAGKPLTVFGEGIQERDFTHVYDIVDIVSRSIRYIMNTNKHTTVFNAGTGVATSIKELALYIATRFQVPLQFEDVKEGSISNLVPGRIRLPFEMQSMRLDMSNTNSILNREVGFTYGQIIEHEVAWYVDNKEKWEKKFKV